MCFCCVVDLALPSGPSVCPEGRSHDNRNTIEVAKEIHYNPATISEAKISPKVKEIIIPHPSPPPPLCILVTSNEAPKVFQSWQENTQEIAGFSTCGLASPKESTSRNSSFLRRDEQDFVDFLLWEKLSPNYTPTIYGRHCSAPTISQHHCPEHYEKDVNKKKN
jgi:hypothetical protein